MKAVNSVKGARPGVFLLSQLTSISFLGINLPDYQDIARYFIPTLPKEHK
jgi:hypothetical protein